jgi:hypothetical protein
MNPRRDGRVGTSETAAHPEPMRSQLAVVSRLAPSPNVLEASLHILPQVNKHLVIGIRTKHGPVLWNDLAPVAEAVNFSPPEETPAGKTGQPDKKAQQVTQGIKPAQGQ